MADDVHTSGSPKTQGYNPLYDPATDNQPIENDVQQRLNTPLAASDDWSETDEAFIRDVVSKVDSGAINLYVQSSLLNQTHYENLTDGQKGMVDQNAFNLLSHLRSIYTQWKANPTPSLQLQNEIHHIRLIKERVEKENGDVFKV